MVSEMTDYSLVIPVHNEAVTLRRTVPALLTAVAHDRVEIVYVCNGCTDGSAELIRTLCGAALRIIEIPKANKAEALNAGDAVSCAFPRFYMDADVTVEPGGLKTLADTLRSGAVELVAPAIRFDTQGTTRVARAISDLWLMLPHGRSSAFGGVLGLSAKGRARWGLFPNILGDDIFVKATISPNKRRIVNEVTAVTRPPSRFWAWVKVRARWLEGERQLTRMGKHVAREPGQSKALLELLVQPRTALAATAFILARLLAEPVSRIRTSRQQVWYSDRDEP